MTDETKQEQPVQDEAKKNESLSLYEELMGIMSSDRGKEYDIGRILFQMHSIGAYKALGYKNFSKLLKDKFELSRRNANRLISKYRLGAKYPMFADAVKKSSAVVADILFMLDNNGCHDLVQMHIARCDKIKVFEAIRLIQDNLGGKAKMVKANRVTFSLPDDEFAEFNEGVSIIGQAFSDVNCVSDAVMAAIRNTVVEAQAIIAKGEQQ